MKVAGVGQSEWSESVGSSSKLLFPAEQAAAVAKKFKLCPIIFGVFLQLISGILILTLALTTSLGATTEIQGFHFGTYLELIISRDNMEEATPHLPQSNGGLSIEQPSPSGSKAMESRDGHGHLSDSQSPSGSCEASLPSPTVGWRKEQSLTPLKLTTNLGALDSSRSVWRVPSPNEVPAGLEVLPSQQALGALAAAVQHLQQVADEFKEVQGAVQALQGAMQTSNLLWHVQQRQKDRLAALEHQRLPALDVRLDCIQRDAAPQELISVLQALHGLNASAMAAQKADLEWRQKSNLERMAITLKSWLVGSVSQMDIALLFLSRRLILGRYGDSLAT
eukprot:scaffold222552_cov49-Prasinocladus_malaysianus.AAC.1